MTFKDYLLVFVGCFLLWAIGTILHDRSVDAQQETEIIELRSSINILTEKNIRLDEELLNLNGYNDELNNRLFALEEINKNKKVKK
jgi:hypothetical protein